MTLRRTAFSAGRWTAASAAFVVGVQLVQTMVLARLLTPAEFGLMAIAAATIAVLALVADMGLNRSLIHFDDVSSNAMSSIYWMNILVSISLCLLTIAAAPAAELIFNSAALVPVFKAISLVFPLRALGTQFRVMAQKELRFSALARNEIAAAISGFLIAVAVALANGGVYALVAGVLSSAAISSLLAWLRLSRGYRPTWHFRLSDTRPYLRFGGYLMGESFASTLHRQADVFIGGWLLGPAAVGLYSIPRDLSLRVAMVVNPIITRVGFPLMSRLKSDRNRLKSIYLETLRMTASVNFPAYVALGLFSEEIVALLYGPRWSDAAPYLQILAGWGFIRSLGNPVGSLLHAVGRVRFAFWWNITLLTVTPVFLWLGIQIDGLMGLAWAMLTLQVLMFIPIWGLSVRQCCGATLREYVGAVFAPFVIALGAGTIAWIAATPFSNGLARLAIGGAIGVVSYSGLSLIFNRKWTEAMIELLKLGPENRHNVAPK